MKRLLVLLFALAALGAACSGTDTQGRPVALSVNDDVEFSRQEIYDQVEVLSGESSNTYESTAVSGWLDTLVVGALAMEIFEERGLPVPEELVVQQLDALQAAPGAADLGEDMLLTLAPLLVAQEALLELVEVDQPAPPTEEAVLAYYEGTAQECVTLRHILVTTETRTAEEAGATVAEIQGRLGAGDEFADLVSEFSEDPGSMDQGGLYDCAPQGSYVPEFDDAAWAQPIGEVGEPVETEFGVHLIVVEERGSPSLEDSRADIEAALAEQAFQALDQERRGVVSGWLVDATLTAEVYVDGRFGRWVPIDIAPSGQPEEVEPDDALAYAILPPEGPEVPAPELPFGEELPPLDGAPVAPGG